MRNCVLTVAAAAAVLFGVTTSAQAQGTGTTTNPTFELAAGYQLFRAGEVCDDDPLEQTCVPDRMFPFGLTVDAVRNFGPFGIVAEGGWSYDTDSILDDEDELPEVDEVDLNFNAWHVGGGFRYTSRKSAGFWPYAQILAGVAHDRISTELADDDFSQTNFMLQPGVGVTWVAGDGWGIFGQFDYRRVFLDEEDNLAGASGRNDMRFVVGVRMILD